MATVPSKHLTRRTRCQIFSESTFTTLVDYVVPIVGIFVGYIFLEEVVSNIFFITLFLIFISLYLAVKDEEENV